MAHKKTAKGKSHPKNHTPWDYLDELLKGRRSDKKAMIAGLFLIFLGAFLEPSKSSPYALIGVACIVFGIVLFMSGVFSYVVRILAK